MYCTENNSVDENCYNQNSHYKTKEETDSTFKDIQEWQKKIKENQKLFLIFIVQVELKMTENKHCFRLKKEQIIYMTSRISDSVYKNISLEYYQW